MTCKSGASAAAVSSKRTWSLPLPVAPWAMASAFSLLGDLHHALGDERPRDAGAEKILALVNRAGLDHRENEVAREFLLQIVDVDLGRAGLLGLWLRGRRVPLPGRCSAQKAIISALYFSLIHESSTEVSSPPE